MAQSKKKAKASKSKQKTKSPVKKTKGRSAPPMKMKSSAAKAKAKSPRLKLVAGGKIQWADFFTPLDDRVLVEVEVVTQTAGGLIIPGTVSEKPNQGRVLAVGRGRLDKKGRMRPMDVGPGDRVLFPAFSGSTLTLQGQDVVILREADLLGILG